MPKASKVGKFRAAAKASSRNVKAAPLTAQHLAPRKDGDRSDAGAAAPQSAEKESLSRGQRKRLAKREQYLKREKMVLSSLRLQRLEEQKGRLDGLDAIREALGEASSSSRSVTPAAKESSKSSANKGKTKRLTCSTNKSKKTLANAEINHMGLVLQHPSFKDNPFAAIQQHLRNSLAPDAEKMEQKSQMRAKEDNEAAAKKKEEKKERLRDAKFSKKKGNRGFKSNRAKRI